MKNQKKILSIIAPSGGGKGTIVKYLLEKYPHIFSLSISATTRAPRGQEKDGVEYYFTLLGKFEKDIKARKFVEYAEVYPGKFYGTYKSEIARINDLGKIPVLDIDYKGAQSVHKIYNEAALTIGLLPPGLPDLSILENRLRARGTETEEKIQERIMRVPEEILHITLHDHVIVNDVLEETYKNVEKILRMYDLIPGFRGIKLYRECRKKGYEVVLKNICSSVIFFSIPLHPKTINTNHMTQKKLKRGLIIPFYGINNLGKTTQAKETVAGLKNQGFPVSYQKYAVYDLEPSGVIINEYLRKGNPYNLTPQTVQTLQVLNRTQFEPTLKEMLSRGEIVICEDYIGTGIAWGMGADISREYLERINSHLLKEDMGLYFYGERFTGGIEKGHKHEEDNELTNKVAKAHEILAEDYGWVPIHANQPIPDITSQIMNHIHAYIEQHSLLHEEVHYENTQGGDIYN